MKLTHIVVSLLVIFVTHTTFGMLVQPSTEKGKAALAKRIAQQKQLRLQRAQEAKKQHFAIFIQNNAGLNDKTTENCVGYVATVINNIFDKHSLWKNAIRDTIGMDIEKPYDLPFVGDIIPVIAQHCDLKTTHNVLRTCKTYRDTCSEGLSHLTAVQCGFNRFLLKNPIVCLHLNQNDHNNVLIHYAKTNNKIMFQHIMKNENTKNIAQRIEILMFFDYNPDSDCDDIINNMKAYQGIAMQKPGESRLFKAIDWTPLHRASENGRRDIVQLLIESGADVNSKDYCDLTPLYIASKGGHKDVVQLLIKSGADVNSKDGEGRRTPLYIASWKGHKDVVQLLIDNGADVNSKDYCDRTPLYRASQKGHKDIVQLLIKSGADVNSKDDNSHTPLHIASERGHKDIVQLLIDNGADVNSKDKYDRTPLYIASLKGHKDIVQLLIDNGAK